VIASGHFFRELSSKKEVGEIEIQRQTASITFQDSTICENIKIQSIQSRKDIYLSNGYLFTLTEPLTREQEKPYLNKVTAAISWLERFSFKKALILSLALLMGLALIRLTLTSTIHLVVAIFPTQWEEKIGTNTYVALKKVAFKKSELSSSRIAKLRNEAVKIVSSNGLRSSEILFHASELIGPNALAFPGGPIVITDDLVRLLVDNELILAVIAHELAHVEQRHSLHQIVEIVGIAAVASVLLGSNDTLIEEASVVALNLWASKKSRAFEKEADLIALQYLENSELEKKSFALAIEKLTLHFCQFKTTQNFQDCIEKDGNGWLSSHPSGAERLNYLALEKIKRKSEID
jgi:Zn-dependent protease with chaperone function